MKSFGPTPGMKYFYGNKKADEFADHGVQQHGGGLIGKDEWDRPHLVDAIIQTILFIPLRYVQEQAQPA